MELETPANTSGLTPKYAQTVVFSLECETPPESVQSGPSEFFTKIRQEAVKTPKPKQDDAIRMCKSKVPGSRRVCNSL